MFVLFVKKYEKAYIGCLELVLLYNWSMEPIRLLANNGVSDPFKKSNFVSMGGVDYLVGALLILLGIAIFLLFQKKATAKMNKYKQEQLDLYNKNRGTNVKDYEDTKLFVPVWEKFKFSAPIMLTVLFIIVGFSFIMVAATGHPFLTL